MQPSSLRGNKKRSFVDSIPYTTDHSTDHYESIVTSFDWIPLLESKLFETLPRCCARSFTDEPSYSGTVRFGRRICITDVAAPRKGIGKPTSSRKSSSEILIFVC